MPGNMIVVGNGVQHMRGDVILQHFAIDDQRFLGHKATLRFGWRREATVHGRHRLPIELVAHIIGAALELPAHMHHRLGRRFGNRYLHIELILIGCLIVVQVGGNGSIR